jgi:hypothetical protein
MSCIDRTSSIHYYFNRTPFHINPSTALLPLASLHILTSTYIAQQDLLFATQHFSHATMPGSSSKCKPPDSPHDTPNKTPPPIDVASLFKPLDNRFNAIVSALNRHKSTREDHAKWLAD